MKNIILISLIISIVAFPREDDALKLGGYLESKLSYFAAENEITTTNAIFRLEGDYDIGNKGKVETQLIYNYDMQPLDPFSTFKNNSIYTKIIQQGLDDFYDNLNDPIAEQAYISLMEIFSDRAITYLPYSSLYPKEKIVMDRALVKMYFKNMDFVLGKQQIAWGTGYAFNPTDIWNIKDPTDADAGKIGVLALNLEAYFGENSSLNIITSPGFIFYIWRYVFLLNSIVVFFYYSFSVIL